MAPQRYSDARPGSRGTKSRTDLLAVSWRRRLMGLSLSAHWPRSGEPVIASSEFYEHIGIEAPVSSPLTTEPPVCGGVRCPLARRLASQRRSTDSPINPS